MSLTELTIDDLTLLEQFRLERLSSFFAQSLSCCLIYFNFHKTLIVHCPEPAVIDNLLNDLDDLCDYAGLILGAEAIALYFVQEEIYRAEICGIRGLSRRSLCC
jgi:hypothetical protein